MSYYDILGIDKDASMNDIKKAYKKLALEHHPDKGGDNNKFQEISNAYSILSNEDKRSEYDSKGNNNDNIPTIRYAYKTKKMNNTNYTLNIELKEVYFGHKKTLQIKLNKLCECIIYCRKCGGAGIVGIQQMMGPFMIQNGRQYCNGCNSRGWNKRSCYKCVNGRIEIKELITIVILPGEKNGKEYIFENKGEQSDHPLDLSGDFIVKLNILKDNLFIRENNNIVIKCEMDLSCAIFGCEMNIPHWDGDIFIDSYEKFGMIESGDYIIKEKGMKYESKNNQTSVGDLIVRIKVIMPKMNELSINDRMNKKLEFEKLVGMNN